jgi:hypothetical protein
MADDNVEILCPTENSEGELVYDNENHQELYESYLNTKDCLDELGIEFPVTYMETGCPLSSPSAFYLDDDTAILIRFPGEEIDIDNFNNWYSEDMMAHEYGHHFLNNFFSSNTSTDHDIIHEYFADLFAIHTVADGCGDEKFCENLRY